MQKKVNPFSCPHTACLASSISHQPSSADQRTVPVILDSNDGLSSSLSPPQEVTNGIIITQADHERNVYCEWKEGRNKMMMMKKQYINPEMTVVALAHQSYLLTVSGDVQDHVIPGDENISLDDDGIEDLIDDV